MFALVADIVEGTKALEPDVLDWNPDSATLCDLGRFITPF